MVESIRYSTNCVFYDCMHTPDGMAETSTTHPQVGFEIDATWVHVRRGRLGPY